MYEAQWSDRGSKLKNCRRGGGGWGGREEGMGWKGWRRVGWKGRGDGVEGMEEGGVEGKRKWGGLWWMEKQFQPPKSSESHKNSP